MAEKDNTPASNKLVKKCSEWVDKILTRISVASELFYQFIFTYGTMTVIAALSICIFLLEPYNLSIEFTKEHIIPEIWSIIINTYMPTTITFVGVLLFSDNFFKEHKFRGVVLELLVVSMGLAYIAFVSINNVVVETTHQRIIIQIIRLINIFFMVPSIVLMPGFFIKKDSVVNSDGNISH